MAQRGSGQLAMDVRRARRYATPLVTALAVLGTAGVMLLVLIALAFGGVARDTSGAFTTFWWLYLAAWPVAIVLWLRWFRAVYRAAGATGVTRHDSVMVGIGWLVPGVWLFVPKRMVDDVWRAGGDRKPVPSVVRWWWAVWSAAMAIRTVAIVDRVLLDNDRWGAGWLGLLEALLHVVAAPLAIATVRALTERLDRVEQWAAALAAWPGERADVARVPTPGWPA